MSTISASTTTTTAYKVTADTTGALVLQTGATPTTAVTIDTSQNVGVNVVPSSWSGATGFQVQRASVFGVTSLGGFASNTYLADSGANYRYVATGTAALYLQNAAGDHRWNIAASGTAGNAITFTQAMTLDASGNLLVGTASGSGYRMEVTTSGVTTMKVSRTGLSGANSLVDWFYNTTNVGSVAVSSTATSYNTSSDYRLKNSVAPMTGALAKIAALKPCTYKWNADDSDGEGFIAHELAEVIPHAVTGEKDAVETYTDEDGNEQTRPKYQGIDTSFLVATLTAAIQELKAELDAAKADIATLKGAA